MRRALLIAFLAVVTAASAHAQSSVNFGGRYCADHFPCDSGAAAYPSTAALISAANGCTGGNSGSGSMFSDAAGLDSDNCLTTDLHNVPASAMTVPQCCIRPIGGGQCAMYCSLLSR